MPTILMTRDGPGRLSGKFYQVTQAEGWELVRDGFAIWQYVPESKANALPSSEPEAKKEIKGALRPAKRPALSNDGEE